LIYRLTPMPTLPLFLTKREGKRKTKGGSGTGVSGRRGFYVAWASTSGCHSSRRLPSGSVIHANRP
jgi:hypothetical protein